MAPSTSYLLASGLWLASLGASAATLCRRDAPTVTVKNGTYSGVHSQEYNQDYFLGMPYAQKPVRFSLAEPLDNTWNGTREATAYPKHCIGYGEDMVGYESSEDCLYLNVVRPAGIDESADLPVAVWIHGGGLFMGGSGDRRYNMSFIVQNSVEMGTPVIGVSLNYRLTAFGFLSGQEVRDAGATNLGFRDQRLALHWIKENIKAFGGSTDKITIFGESSGAESVSAQTLAYNGRDDGLFHAAIGQSGFGGVLARFPGGQNNTDMQQTTYNRLVSGTSCAPLMNSSDSLDCLRKLPFPEINEVLNVSNSQTFLFPPVMDGDFIADYPSNQLADGRFPKIPILIGCNADEGTSFGNGRGPPEKGTRIETDEDFAYAVRSVIGPDQQSGRSVEELVQEALYVYPDIQAVGVPSLSKWPAIVSGDEIASIFGIQWRRIGAFFGDYMFHAIRRRANLAWNKAGLPSYSYLFDVTVNGLPGFIGATHFQEVAFVFYNLNGDGYATNPFANKPDSVKNLAKTINTAWINFFVHHDPNGPNGLTLQSGSAWPVYNTTVGGGVGQEILFTEEGASVQMDSWRAEGMNWLIQQEKPVFGN